MAHSSFPQGKSRDLWLDRYAAFATAAGAPSETVTQARSGVAEQTTLLQPEQDEATLKEAGSAQLLI